MKNFEAKRWSVLIVLLLLFVIGLIYQKYVINDSENISHGSVSLTEKGERIYTSDQYNFSIKIPSDWKVYESDIFGETPKIFFYPKQSISEPPFQYGQNEEFVAIYPIGFSVGGETGWQEDFSDEENIKRYITQDGKVWSIEKKFNEFPSSWKNWGFVFGSVEVNKLEEECLRRDGNEASSIPLRECNPVMGDIIIKRGEVNQDRLNIINEIIDSLIFN